jgi:hypothetical protein
VSVLDFHSRRRPETATARDTYRPSYPPFHHRFNPDGTVESICAECFLTVATANSYDQLHEKEAAHSCSGLT